MDIICKDLNSVQISPNRKTLVLSKSTSDTQLISEILQVSESQHFLGFIKRQKYTVDLLCSGCLQSLFFGNENDQTSFLGEKCVKKSMNNGAASTTTTCIEDVLHFSKSSIVVAFMKHFQGLNSHWLWDQDQSSLRLSYLEAMDISNPDIFTALITYGYQVGSIEEPYVVKYIWENFTESMIVPLMAVSGGNLHSCRLITVCMPPVISSSQPSTPTSSSAASSSGPSGDGLLLSMDYKISLLTRFLETFPELRNYLIVTNLSYLLGMYPSLLQNHTDAPLRYYIRVCATQYIEKKMSDSLNKHNQSFVDNALLNVTDWGSEFKDHHAVILWPYVCRRSLVVPDQQQQQQMSIVRKRKSDDIVFHLKDLVVSTLFSCSVSVLPTWWKNVQSLLLIDDHYFNVLVNWDFVWKLFYSTHVHLNSSSVPNVTATAWKKYAESKLIQGIESGTLNQFWNDGRILTVLSPSSLLVSNSELNSTGISTSNFVSLISSFLQHIAKDGDFHWFLQELKYREKIWKLICWAVNAGMDKDSLQYVQNHPVLQHYILSASKE